MGRSHGVQDRHASDRPGQPLHHVDRLNPAYAHEQNDAVVCESGFGPVETIYRMDHNDTLTITVSVGLDELASAARQTR